MSFVVVGLEAGSSLKWGSFFVNLPSLSHYHD